MAPESPDYRDSSRGVANDNIVEIEEAELSSEDDNPAAESSPNIVSPRSSAANDDDFVLDDEANDSPPPDDTDGSKSPDSRSPSPSPPRRRSSKRSIDSRSSPDSASRHTSPKRSPRPRTNSNRDSNTSQSDRDSSDHHNSRHHSHSDNESFQRKHEDVSDREKDSSPIPANGTNHSSDSDDQSQQPTRRRRRPHQKLVIPTDMRDDDQYFRRSGRSRAAPSRFNASASPAPSSSSRGSDLDFNADEAAQENDEEEEDDDDDDVHLEDDDVDDDDFDIQPSRKSRSSRPRKQVRRHVKEEDNIVHAGLESEASGSDGDWRLKGSKRPSRRRRRKRSNDPPRKRLRTQDSEDDDGARSARINSRIGQVVDYREADEGEFLLSDQDAAKKTSVEQLEDSNLPYIELVLDYRVREGESPPPESDLPLADFDARKVELKIKWTQKSYRKCTWESIDALRNIKGFKRVLRYIKEAESGRDYLQSDATTPEEIEEARVQREEYLACNEAYQSVDRVIAKRDSFDDPTEPEFFVKWKTLPYSDCTWETRDDLSSVEDVKAIDDFFDRENAVLNNTGKKRFNPFNTKDERPKFKRMTEQPGYLHGEGRTLRDYQLAGLNFLAFSWTKRNNVILADEMGLGKTLQTISFIGWLMYIRSIPGPFLVVVPLSTIAAWVREFDRWLPEMNVVCYVGDGPSRETIRRYELYSDEKRTEKFHVLLITPELLMLDHEHLNGLRWSLVAVDEAHRLKNETSALHNNLAALRSANRLLVTGTPLQNSVRELWALLHFLNPDVFTNADDFEAQFSFTALRDPEQVSLLHQTLRPYIIRRQKGDVEKSLPKKTYSVLRVGMTSAQQQYYRWLLTRNFTMLNASGMGRGMGPAQNIRNLVMELKKCCNHPFLFPNYEDTSKPSTVDDLVRASGKMILLDKLLLRLREKGHRVLIFSQMVRMLDILHDYCRMRQFPCQRLDGSVKNIMRQRAVDHFNAPDSTDFIFLLSTRAGGLGINLATADTVIIFDSDWNPQNDLQAESRAHRIGQKKDVKVFRLLSGETVEEDILERAKRKRVLEHVVIHGVEGGHKSDGKDNDMAFKKEELSAILRFGAEKLFAKDRLEGNGEKSTDCGRDEPNGNGDAAQKDDKDDTAEEKRVLAVDDIDELLDRAPTEESSQVGSAQPSIGDSLLNAFKWADFKTVEEEEIEDDKEEEMKMAKQAASKVAAIDREATDAQKHDEMEKEMIVREGDVEFWQRVIPGSLKEDAIANDVIIGTRRRKRTATYHADSPNPSKRRRVSRGLQDRDSDAEELSMKEQKSLFRSFRRFGDPKLASTVLRDAGLEERIDEDDAMAMLKEVVEQAQQAVNANSKRENGDPAYHVGHRSKDSKSKANRVLIDVLGEKGVDAAELLKRCEDLQMLRKHISTFQPDTMFRFQRPMKPPSYSNIRWKASNDAMLLVGVYRYGLGNWTPIAQDEELNLADRMQVAGNPRCKPGAPDTTKLLRRIMALLRQLEREIQTRSKSRRTASPESKHSKANKSRGAGKTISKSHKRPRGNGSNKKEHITNGAGEYIAKRLELKNTSIQTLRELRLLSKDSCKVERIEKIRRTKQCLLKLGRSIDKQAESRDATLREAVEKDLWHYVHDVCRTHLDGAKMHGIYTRLAEAEDEKEGESPNKG